MPWWVYLIIAVVLVIAAMIIGYIWGRKTSPDVDRKALVDSERKALEEEIEAEKIARATAEQARDQHAKDLKKILTWYNQRRGAIDAAAQKEFTDLVSDPDALDRKLDTLLGKAEESGSD